MISVMGVCRSTLWGSAPENRVWQGCEGESVPGSNQIPSLTQIGENLMSEERDEAYRKFRRLKKIVRETKDDPEKEVVHKKAAREMRKIKELFGFDY